MQDLGEATIVEGPATPHSHLMPDLHKSCMDNATADQMEYNWCTKLDDATCPLYEVFNEHELIQEMFVFIEQPWVKGGGRAKRE